ncbi:lysostaphin resistance A-like protein [Patescibacteria group bacterium]
MNASEFVDELIMKPLLLLFPVLLYMFIRYQKTIYSLFPFISNIRLHVRNGFILGVLLVAIQYGMRLLSGNIEVNFSDSMLVYGSAFIIATFTATVEEIVFRGFFQSQIKKHTNIFVGIVLGSFLFAFSHVPIAYFVLQYSSIDTFFYAFLVFQMGAILGIAYEYTESLIPSIVAHTLWNFSSVYILLS